LHANFPWLHLRVGLHSRVRGPLLIRLLLQASPHLLPAYSFFVQMTFPKPATIPFSGGHFAGMHFAVVLDHCPRPVQVMLLFPLLLPDSIQPFLPLMLHCLPIVVPAGHDISHPRIAAGALQSVGRQAAVEPLQEPSVLHMRLSDPTMLYPYLHENLQPAPYRMLVEL